MNQKYVQVKYPEKITAEKEISILYDLGLESYEIAYLIHSRDKDEISKKWTG